MATYKDLKLQMERLAEETERARLAELHAVIEEVRAKAAEYGLTAEDIFGRRQNKRGARTAPLPAKYRDPKTGATWSGRGRQPEWIKGKKRERFLIEP